MAAVRSLRSALSHVEASQMEGVDGLHLKELP